MTGCMRGIMLNGVREFSTFFHKDQLDAFQKGVMSYRYRDVLCQKNPIDIAIYMRLIAEVRPATIIEIGSKAGGSALLFRDLTRTFGIDCRVISIDLIPPPVAFDGIAFLQGDVLLLEETFRRHDLHACPRPWLVIDDSAHTQEACTAVLTFFADALEEGECLIIEDGALVDLGMAEKYQGGPNAAISTYFEMHPSTFEIATEYCDMFGQNATYSPNGYLRKRASPEIEAQREAEEAVDGKLPHIKALKNIHRWLSPSFYLEIGVSRGRSLRLARCRAIGVDPAYRLDHQLPPDTTFVQATSDEFFATRAPTLLDGARPDLIFIDGMHLFENAFRDFINAEKVAPRHGLIIIDDVIPNHPAQAARERRTKFWTGDVWKLRGVLSEHRPDLYLLPLDTTPVGMLIVAGLNPESRVLAERYDSIVETYAANMPVPPEALSRSGAVQPDGPEVRRLIRKLRSVREGKMKPDRLVVRLRNAPAPHDASDPIISANKDRG